MENQFKFKETKEVTSCDSFRTGPEDIPPLPYPV